jgi:hypothetical protein
MMASGRGNSHVLRAGNIVLYRGRRPGWNARDPVARATLHVVCRGRFTERITGNSDVTLEGEHPRLWRFMR